MSKLIPGNQKHLNLQDRLFIEEALSEGSSFTNIAKFLCKDPTTISKEIRAHRALDTWHRGSFNNPQNFCVHRYRCRKVNICERLHPCEMSCRSCSRCNSRCSSFELEHCVRLSKAPYVCNGCKEVLHKCPIANKYHYDARFAQRHYEHTLVSSREGINMSKHALHELDALIRPLILQGQSPYMILASHPELGISVSTLYRLINSNSLLTRRLDLKRQVKFKKRRCHKTQIKNREVFIGRLYSDFQALNLSPDSFVEMDTVLSARGSNKCILTFYFPDTQLFLAHLLPRCTPGAVKLVFDTMQNALGGPYGFLSLFPVILTDRGKEFGDPDALETSPEGFQRSSLYYCDPMRSSQKGGIENVHTKLREILPKGTIFEHLSQWDIRKAVDHINSAPRKRLGGKTPYRAAIEKMGPDILRALKLREVPPDLVTLSPKLLKK